MRPYLIALRVIILTLFVGLLAACAEKPDFQSVYVVRHAEKDTGPAAGTDPNLSPAGKIRAQALSDLLFGENIAYIHSTDYKRTRNTAAPLSEKTGEDIRLYDPSDLAALAAKIKSLPGNHVIVGHSNTVIETVKALGAELSGEAALPIDDKAEFDRVYWVRISDTGVEASLHRYDEKPKGDQ